MGKILLPLRSLLPKISEHELFYEFTKHTQWVYFFSPSMDSDFIERLQSIHLTEEESEVIKVQSENQAKILEECSLGLMGRFPMTKPFNM